MKVPNGLWFKNIILDIINIFHIRIKMLKILLDLWYNSRFLNKAPNIRSNFLKSFLKDYLTIFLMLKKITKKITKVVKQQIEKETILRLVEKSMFKFCKHMANII